MCSLGHLAEALDSRGLERQHHMLLRLLLKKQFLKQRQYMVPKRPLYLLKVSVPDENKQFEA
jgi:hypothetical protein